jgi:hypothetical protein
MTTADYHDRSRAAGRPAAPVPLSLAGRLAQFFRAHAGEWLDGRRLATIAGCYAWRSRVSDLRRAPYVMRVENRQRRVTLDDGRRVTISEYLFIGEPASRLLPLEARSPGVTEGGPSVTDVAPHNLDAERSVLGAILIDNDAFNVAASLLDGRAFFRDAHRRTWAALTRLQRRGIALDLVALKEELERAGDLDEVGGPAYIAGLVDGVPRSTNVEFYAGIVRDKSRDRDFLGVLTRAAHAVHTDADVSDLVDRTARECEAIAAGRSSERGDPIVITVSNVAPEAIQWLWPGRLAFRKLTILAGNPGLGKSMIALDVAARASSGRPLPGGSPALGPIDVLIIAAEDGIADTIRPRLDQLGADVARVHVLRARVHGDREAPITLGHVDTIGAAVDQVGARVVIIDPLSAYLGDTDSHRDAEVRGLMTPIAELAERKGVAVIGVMHLSKTAGRSAIHRASGSVAFVAQARFALAVIADPQNRERRYLAPMKCNLAKEPTTLAYTLPDGRLTWDQAAVENFDLDGTLAAGEGTPRDKGEQTDAAAVIRDLLADAGSWPLDAREALEAGRAHGIPERTMQWTARRLGIRVVRSGFGRGGKWQWHRPDHIPATVGATPLNAETVAPIASIENPLSIGVKTNKDATTTTFPRAHEGGLRV